MNIRINKKICLGMFLLFGILFMTFFVSADYMRSNPKYTQFSQQESGDFDKSMCEAGQDFIIQIAPFGCTPAVVRSDLLEEQNVAIFCQLAATKINPLIEVEAIESISFTGEYPEEVSGIGFHPANAALGVKENLNSPILNNIGYTVIVLKKQQNASAMPDFVEGDLTAKIKYDIKNAFGVGKASFYLPEFTDLQWEEKYTQYGFWNNRAYLKAEEIENDRAIISIYDNNKKISSSALEKGETSEEIYLPGFDCLAGLELKLNDIKNPDTRAKLRINADIVEVAEGERFLENKCYVQSLDKRGMVQKVNIRCQEDDGVNKFDLGISPKIILNIGEEEKEVSLGDVIYEFGENEEKRIFLGHIGQTSEGEDFIVPVVSPAKTSEEFLDSVIAKTLPSFVKMYTSKTGSQTIEVLKSIELGFYGSLTIVGNAIVTGSYPLGMYTKQAEEASTSDTLFDFTAIFARAVDTKLQMPKIGFVGFAGAQDKELDEESEGYYESAISDYETIMNNFAGEKHPEDESITFDELALVEEIKLLRDIGKKKTMVELCEEFKEKYPNSAYKSELEECYDSYKLSNIESTSNYVLINGRVKKISFDGIYEPSLDDYSVRIIVQNAGNYSGIKILQKNEKIDVSETEFISLKELDNDYAIFDVSSIEETIGKELTYKSQSLKIELNNYQIIGKNNYNIRVEEINLKKIAQVSVIPSIDNVGTEANFKFKIGIEQRTIQLSPEKTQEKIDALNKTIEEWQGKSEGLGTVVKGLKTACLGTGAALTIKNFFANTGGKAIARQTVMRGEEGWYEQCAELVETNVYENQEQCMVGEANNIDRDVELVSEIMNGQNIQIKELEKEFTEKKFLSESVVDTDKFMEEYSPLVQKYLSDNFGEKFTNPDNPQESIDRDTMISTLSYESWKNNSNYNKVELRDIQLYSMLLQNPDASPEVKNMVEKRLYSVFSEIEEASQNYVDRNNLANDWGISANQMSFLEIGESVKEIPYGGFTYSDIETNVVISGVDGNTPVEILHTSQANKYVILLDDSSGTDKLPIKKNEENKLLVYDINGILISDDKIPSELNKVYFKKYDASSYKNKFKSSSGETVPLVRYYETEPYKGFPAIVPFDLDDGWYAATKQTLPVLGNIKAYDDSGRVTSFWLCNVGKNGREENIGGDDICQMINLGTGQPYNQFNGLTGKEASARITAGVKAIEQASRQYKSGVNTVNINVGYGNFNIRVGSPSVDIPDMQCQDFMSPKDCQLLFNVCDPVICPSSRCDFGGAYPVKDVIQSGIIGSLVLCLPNVKEGIYLPVCLSGLKAGIDGYLSVLTSHRDCLQHSLDTGETIGICDEIYSIHLCEFFWRQALPLAKLIVPKAMEIFLGQNTRGGGEYLGVSSAWDNAEKSVDYFTQYYAANSYKAFKARSAEDVGGEFCKVSVSGVYPDSGNLLDSLVEPDSPPQFHGRFDEIPFTSATVPPISHYKVFYHIFAGKDSGAYYQVYLKGATGSSFYQDTSNRRNVASGYIGVGEYASETNDFTAPAGYQEMCINVNGQEECGFKQVSTSFAVEYVKEQYLSSQVQEVDIETEKGCISGSASVYSLLNPNLQEGVGEAINPEIYNRGIIRICATDNPGKGTDVYAGGEGARWVEVGYCDNKNIRCWLDTQSVENVIKNTDIEEEALQVVTGNQLDILRNKEGYIFHKEFLDEIENIEEEKDSSNKINLINAVFEKVFLNSEKAHLFFLRGNVYAELAVMKYKELIEAEKKPEVTVETPVSPEEEEEEQIEDEPEVEIIGDKIWLSSKELADREYNHCRIQDGKSICSYVCAGFVTKVLTDSGVKDIECGIGKGDSIEYLIEEFETRNDFIEIDKNELKQGDIIILGWGTETTQHSAIFSNYENNGEIFRVWGDSDDPEVPYVKLQSFRIYNRVYAAMSNKWWFYKAFRFTGELEEIGEWNVESAIQEVDSLLQEYGDVGYLQNCYVKNFIEQLFGNGVLAEFEYDKIVAQDLGELKKLLLVKKLA